MQQSKFAPTRSKLIWGERNFYPLIIPNFCHCICKQTDVLFSNDCSFNEIKSCENLPWMSIVIVVSASKNIYYISLENGRPPPPSSSIETPFPCLYNCTLGSWQLYRHTATAVYSRQSSLQTGKRRVNL